MSTHNPVGSCCNRPRFNFVGGIDDRTEPYRLLESRFVHSPRKIGHTVFLGVSIFLALAVAYACAQLLLAN
jgi:hypothetical protein